MTRFAFRRIATAGIIGLVAIGVHACKDSTGPDGIGSGHYVDIPVTAQLPSDAAGALSAKKAHAVVHRGDGTVALDTTIVLSAALVAQPLPQGFAAASAASIAAGSQFVLHVQLSANASASGEDFTITLEILDDNGAVLFTSTPVVLHAAIGETPSAILIPTAYAGLGSSAVSVNIGTPTVTVNAGGTVDLTAQAFDANSVVVPNSPIIWTSLDPTIASIPNPLSGHVVIAAARGPARIRASLVTGQSAGATITVVPVPSAISISSGNGQALSPGAVAAPLVVKAVATDGLGLAGIVVNFAVQSGGGLLTAAQVVTNDDGLASVGYTFGPTAGTTTIVATSTGMSGSPLTFTLSSSIATGTKLAFTSQPGNAVVGANLTPVIVEVRDLAGNRVSGFNGAVSIALSSPPAGVQLHGTLTVNAVGGVATFSDLTVSATAPALQLVATLTGATSATSNTFAVTARQAVSLSFAGQIPNTPATVTLPSVIVEAFDAFGALSTGYTGPVTISLLSAPAGVTLNGVLTAVAVGGQATFTGLSVSGPATGVRLVATGTGITGSFQSNVFDIGVVPNPIVVTGAPVSFAVQRTAASPAAKTVQLSTNAGPITGLAAGTITYGPGANGWLSAALSPTTSPSTLTITPSTGSLPEGTFTATVPVTGSGGASAFIAVTVVVSPLPVTQLAVITDPAGAVSGLQFVTQPVVEQRDATGTRVLGTATLVTAAVGTGPGVLSGTTTATTVQGRATFTNLRITGAGAHTLAFTAPGTPGISSGSFTVGAALSTTQAVAAITTPANAAITPVTPVTAAGGVTPYTFAISPALPNGLTMSSTTGQITGTPTTTLALSTFTVTVTDATVAQSSKTFTLTINLGLGTTLAQPNVSETLNSLIVPVTPVTASGGTAPLVYAISPALPAGLAFNTTTGQITGTPTATLASTPFTVTVTDGLAATSSKIFNLTVNGALTTTQAIAAKSGTIGTAISAFTPVTASGGTAPITFGVSPALPTGLSITPATGAIAGTPLVALATATFTVTATDAAGATSAKTFTLTINGALTTTTAVANTTSNVGVLITPFTPVTAAGGTAPLAWAITSGGSLPSGLSLNAATGQINGTPTTSLAATTFTMTVTDAAGATSAKTFQDFTVNGPLSATQQIATKVGTVNTNIPSFIPVTAGGGTTPYTYSISPALPAGMSITAGTGAVSGTPSTVLAATPFTVTVTDGSNATATAQFTLTVNGALTTVLAQGTATGTVNTAMTAFTPVTASGGTTPYTFTVSPGLPSGLTISSTTGTVSGTPTITHAVSSFTVTATDAAGATSSKAFSLTVNGGVSTVLAVAAKVGTVTAALSYTPVTATGGTAPLGWSITAGGALPAGLNLNATNGLISGTPTASHANSSYTMTVTDAVGATSSQIFQLSINAAVAATATVPIKIGTINNAIASYVPVTASAGTAPYTFALTTGVLPAGMNFSTSTGAVSGTPTATLAQTTFTVTITDAAGATANANFQLTVNGAIVTTVAVPSTVGDVNLAIPAFTPVTGTGGTAPLAWSIIAGSLPTGMSISGGTGQITGTPTTTLPLTTFTVRITDAVGATATASFNLTVNNALNTVQAVASKVVTQSVALTPFTPVTASGGSAPLSFAITGANPLPTGVNFSTTTGQITGNPSTALAQTTYTVTVTDNVGATSSKTFDFTVNAATPGIKLNVSASATGTVAVGQDIVIPLLVDMTNRGSDNMAAIDVTITWDPTKFSLTSQTAGNWTDGQTGDPATVTNNPTSGQLHLAGFVSNGTTTSFTLRTITLHALATASPSTVAATIAQAGSSNGGGGTDPITVTPRNLAVTITP